MTAAPQIDVRERDLDPALRRLFDPATPLTHSIVFLADDSLVKGEYGFFYALAALLTALFGLSSLKKMIAGEIASIAEWLVEAAICAACVAGVIWFYRQIRVIRNLSQDVRQGRWRYGVFLLPDALVWRTQKSVSVIPRQNVTTLAYHTVRWGTANTRVTLVPKIVYDGGDGTRGELVLSARLKLRNRPPSAVTEALGTWCDPSKRKSA